MRPLAAMTERRAIARRCQSQSNIAAHAPIVSILGHSIGSGGVVVDDFPAAEKLAEDQRKQAVRSFAIGHLQMPGAADEGGFRSKHLDLQVGEIQRSHFMSRTVVGGPIAIQGRLPAAGLFTAGKECQFGGVPIACHEAVKVVMIPGILLVAQDMLNGGLGITRGQFFRG